MSSARRIYVSAVHEEFPEVLEVLRLSLEELGCLMVTLEASPPYWRTLDKRIRDRVPTCEAVLHLVGQRCGRCPDVPTVPKDKTRSSVAQMEHEISAELAASTVKLPLGVHVIVSGDGHTAPSGLRPEDEAQVQMQTQHRESLLAAGTTHDMPQDGTAWKQLLCRLLGLVDPSTAGAAMAQLPPPSITIRPARQEAKPASGMSPIAIGVIVVGVLVVGLGLLDMLKSKKTAGTAAATEVAAPFDAAIAHQVLQTYVSIYRDWMRDTVDMPVMYLDHWTRLTLPERAKLPESQVKSLLEQSITQDIGPAFTVEDRLAALLAAGKYQTAMDFALVHQAALSAEGFEIAALAAASRFDQTVSTSHEERAIRFYRSAVEKTDPQKEPASWARRQSALATLLDVQGLKSEALTLSAAAVAALEKVPDQAPLELAYARLLTAQNLRGEKAVELGKKAIAIFEQEPYKEAPLKLMAWSMMATVHLNETAGSPGYTSEAVVLLRNAVNESEKKLGPTHPLTGYHLYRLGSTFASRAVPASAQAEGGDSLAKSMSDAVMKTQLTEAETYLQRALTLHEAGYGSKHLNTAYALSAMGQLFSKQGRFAEAEPLHRRALTIAMEHLGSRHPKLAYFKTGLAGCLQKTGNIAETEKLMRESLEELETFGIASKQELCGVYLQTASILSGLKKYSEAARLLEKALANAPENDLPLRSGISINLFNTHMLDQRLGDARLVTERALPVLLRTRMHLEDPNRALISMLRAHAVWKTQLGEPASALKARYQVMFKDAGVDNDTFENIWIKVAQ